MTVKYVELDGERVSTQWGAVLAAARRDGVVFHLNEGHRTMARQQELFDLFKAGRGNLAAKPGPNAPHIRVGRIDHAIDVDGSDALIAWSARHGISLQRTVAGESWHLEADANALIAFVRKNGTLEPTLRKGQKGKAIKVLQQRLRARGFVSVPSAGEPGHGYFGESTVSAVKRFQAKRGLDADGIVGPLTHKALTKAIA
ncbi:MAG: peptidoglycan-binding protein [Solirubrobacteraceae bacterium]